MTELNKNPDRALLDWRCKLAMHKFQIICLIFKDKYHTINLERCSKCGFEREFDQQDLRW